MNRRVLFLVNGLGLGNSTRCYAIIEELQRAQAEVEVVSSDNGLWFFSDKPGIRLTPIPSLHYGAQGGRISIASTIAQSGALLTTLRAAENTIAATIARFRPDVVVGDSVYSLRPVRRAGLPLAAINNADMVVRGMGKFRDWPASVLPQFLVVELADYAFHRWAADMVISPRLDPADAACRASTREVGPIVRAECAPVPVANGKPRRVAIMLSGSVFGSPVRLKRQRPGLRIDVIGRPQPTAQEPSGDVLYHGKIRDALALLREADLVMVNGGFSAVSESVMLGKPVVVIPVPHHAEQWVNGRTVEHLGIGMSAPEGRLEDALDEALGRIDRFREAYRRLPPMINGAPRAARAILDLAEGRTP